MKRLLRKIILSFLFLFAVWLGGFCWFVAKLPVKPLADDARADAIIVLTGGSGRLEYGMQLLAEEKGKKLFISGVSEGVSRQDLLRQVSPEVRQKLASLPFMMGRHAENTIGNAEETSNWLKAEGYSSILLVTASYHMPRSIEEFEEIRPKVKIIPAPVFPEDFVASGWWANPASRIIILSEYHKFLASKLRHWIVSATHRS